MTDTPAPTKTPRQGRSPAFPYIPLGKAIERAESLRVAEGGRPKHAIPWASICKAFDVGPKTGNAKQTIAAMGYFGIFEFEGTGDQRSARISEKTMRILLDKQPVSAERTKAIQEMALAPAVHKELWEKWQADLPSEATLETYLVRDRGFSESGARELMHEYKATLSYAKLGQPVTMSDEASSGDVPDGESTAAELVSAQKRAIELAAAREAEAARQKGHVNIMAGERVVFTEEGQPSQYLKLIANGDLDDFLLEALEDFVKRQRKRLKAAPPSSVEQN